ncbi:MAG: hypothetical protein JXX14_10535, partial [Deltaproteobacteria bacterium]|nr:hypothetical protein [Deltaproteobacteria bacterium]
LRGDDVMMSPNALALNAFIDSLLRGYDEQHFLLTRALRAFQTHLVFIRNILTIYFDQFFACN